MFFVLSKILFFLIDPSTWILGLLIVGFFSRSIIRKKRIYISAFVLCIVLTNPFLFNKVSLWWQPKWNDVKDGKKYTVGILLGGMSYYDKYDRGYFGSPADRFIQTANLYHEGKIKKILITGGSGNFFINEPDESSFLAKEFIRNGIPAEDIILEKKSRNTYENAVFSKHILDSTQIAPPYLLLTSTQHMPRASMVFRKAGYTTFEIYPCDFQEFEKKWEPKSVFIPELQKINDWKYLIKEWVGILAYKLTGKA
jgi:uncharacterized SAM-binding protein YcdF (DUF218 family)